MDTPLTPRLRFVASRLGVVFDRDLGRVTAVFDNGTDATDAEIDYLLSGWNPYDGGTLSDYAERDRVRGEWLRIAHRVRPMIFKRDGKRCRHCGADGDDVRFHIDHVIPIARGGTNEPDNLQVLCQPCNQRKWAH